MTGDYAKAHLFGPGDIKPTYLVIVGKSCIVLKSAKSPYNMGKDVSELFGPLHCFGKSTRLPLAPKSSNPKPGFPVPCSVFHKTLGPSLRFLYGAPGSWVPS